MSNILRLEEPSAWGWQANLVTVVKLPAQGVSTFRNPMRG